MAVTCHPFCWFVASFAGGFLRPRRAGPNPCRRRRAATSSAKSLSVTPAVVFVAGHDTNAIRTNTGTPADEFYVVPQVEGWLGRGRTQLNFATALEFAQQQSVSEGTSPTSASATVNQYHVARLDVGGQRIELCRAGRLPRPLCPADRLRRLRARPSSRAVSRPNWEPVVRSARADASFYRGLVTARPAALRRRRPSSRAPASSRTSTVTSRIFGGEAQVAADAAVVGRGFGRTTTATGSCSRRYRDGNGTRYMAGAQFQPRALIGGRAEVGYLSTSPCRPSQLRRAGVQCRADARPRRRCSSTSRARAAIDYSFDPEPWLLRVQRHRRLLGGHARRPAGRRSAAARSAAWTRRGPLACRSRSAAFELYKAGLVRQLGDGPTASAPTSSATSPAARVASTASGATVFLDPTAHDPPAAPRPSAAGRISDGHHTRLLVVRPARRSSAVAAARRGAAGYQIGQGDLLKVAVWSQPELSGEFTVDVAGGDHDAARSARSRPPARPLRRSKTTSGRGWPTATSSTRKSPSASRQFNSQRVFVVGEVRTPGVVPLSGTLTLVEALTRVGSLTESAGGELVVIRPAEGKEVDRAGAGRRPRGAKSAAPRHPAAAGQGADEQRRAAGRRHRGGAARRDDLCQRPGQRPGLATPTSGT